MKKNILSFTFIIMLLTSINCSADTSNVACYFLNGSSVSWKWALNSKSEGNSWYVMNGKWRFTTHTKLEKFFTSTSFSDICAACENARVYYNIKGVLFAQFAATSNTGNNYPIVINGFELSPMY